MPFSLDLQPACLFLSLSFGKENHARIHIPSVQLNFPPLNSLYTCLYRKEEKSPPLKNYLFVWLHWVLVVACGIFGAFQVVLVIKKIHLSMQETPETWVGSLGREDPLEEEMATHSSILTWKIPQTEESGRLQSMGSSGVVGHDWVRTREPLGILNLGPLHWPIREIPRVLPCEGPVLGLRCSNWGAVSLLLGV